MSAPRPEKWWATDEEIADAAGQAEYGNDRKIRSLVQAIARRRALEELGYLATMLLLMGMHPDDARLLLIHKRIAEIEAEGK